MQQLKFLSIYFDILEPIFNQLKVKIVFKRLQQNCYDPEGSGN
jgi:hypothetical protein